MLIVLKQKLIFSDAWEFGCLPRKSWRRTKPVLQHTLSTLFYRHKDLLERRNVNFFAQMGALNRMKFLSWFTHYANDFLLETIESIQTSSISVQQLEAFVAEKCFAPIIIGRKKFTELFPLLGKLNTLLRLNDSKRTEELLILLIQISSVAERESLLASLSSASASHIEMTFSLECVTEAFKYVKMVN